MKPLKKPDPLLLFIVCLSMVLMLIGDFRLIELEDGQNYKYVRGGGYLLQLLFWMIYFYKTRSKKSMAK